MELEPIFYTLSSIDLVIIISGLCTILSICFSSYLIRKHLSVFTKPTIQSKILGIIYMVPIYSIDSFLGLLWPYQAVYIDMARDCYEAYVLYLFLSLMLSYLECEIDDTEVVNYLESQPSQSLPCPFNYCFPGEIPRGREFLRYCKFGTLQYCVIRPTTAIAAIILDVIGVYHEGDFSMSYGYIYVLIVINISVAYAFMVLATFYTILKSKLKPFEPIGKFLCIKFVIFFAFWQSVMISGMVRLGWIEKLGEYGPDLVATGLQNFLICIEMMFVAFAHIFTFSYKPFDPINGNAGMYEKLVSSNSEDIDDEEALYFSTDRTKLASKTKENYRKYLRKSNKLSAVVLPRFLDKSTPATPIITTNSAELQSKSSPDNTPEKTAGFEPLETLDPERTEEEEERYERELMFDSQLWQKSNLKMKAQLLGNHLKLGAEDTIRQAVKKTKKSLKKISSSKGGSSVNGSIGSRMPYPPNTNDNIAPNTLLDRHFAANAAIRDFNEAMPVVVLPSQFEPKKGIVIRSDPASRVQDYEEAQAEQSKPKQKKRKPSQKTKPQFTIEAEEDD